MCCHIFLCIHKFHKFHKFHKIQNYFIFELLKTNIWASFQRIVIFLPKYLPRTSQKYGFEIWEQEQTYSGSPVQGSKRHRIPDPQHWEVQSIVNHSASIILNLSASIVPQQQAVSPQPAQFLAASANVQLHIFKINAGIFCDTNKPLSLTLAVWCGIGGIIICV